MKIRFVKRHQDGVATVLVLLLTTLLLLLVTSNSRALHWLSRELDLAERNHIRRAEATPASPSVEQLKPD